MKISDLGHRLARCLPGWLSAKDTSASRLSTAGNVFFAVFAAVAMVGAVGYGFNTVLRGPISGMSDITRRTVAESTVITASRLAIVGATTHQTAGGNCDTDPLIEPLPYFSAGTAPHPTGGGYLPRGGPPTWTLLPSSKDPWSMEYGYCAWDSGADRMTAGCGGAGALRLSGSPNKNQYSFAIISAGKNRVFETTCAAYVDTSPADGKPDTPMVNKPNGSDDIVLPYTYAEANDLGNGLWSPLPAAPTTALKSDKNIEVTGSATFNEAVQLTGTGGLVLPGDPGDDSLTGACNAANDKQLRRNIADPANPVIEVCDFGGLGWSSVSGGSGGGGPTSLELTGTKVAHWKLDETSGTTAFDSWGGSNGTFINTPVWSSSGGQIGGALNYDSTDDRLRIPRNAYLEPTAVTISMWAKSNILVPGGTSLITKEFLNGGGPSYLSYSLFADAPGRLRFFTGGAATTDDMLVDGSDGTFLMPVNKWFHVVASYDPNAAAPQKRVFVDGVLMDTKAFNVPMNYDKTATGDLYIGSRNVFNGAQAWPGMIDDVRIYNYALSDAEIAEIYASSQSSINQTGPLKKGKVLMWGDDTNGKLANGSTLATTFAPETIVNTSDFLQGSVGNDHACAVKSDGTVWCWGMDNCGGKLGDGATTATDSIAHTPTQVSGLTDAIKVTTSICGSCALKKDGSAWCWGGDSSGELGNGPPTLASNVPVKVLNITDFVDIAISDGTACGVRQNGEAYCWGHGYQGALGNGVNGETDVPSKVSTITDFVQLDGTVQTLRSMCGVTKRGLAYCWGQENSGSFGNGATSGNQNTPSLVSNITDFKKVEVGVSSTCGLRGTGEIYCWGSDSEGQLGNGATSTDQTVPVAVNGISDFIDVTVGTNNACGIRANGEAWCWGQGDFVGDGANCCANDLVPVRVAGGTFSSISAGYRTTLGIMDATPRKNTPATTPDRDRLTTGRFGGCVIDNDKTAWCWGKDAVGELGNGATTGTKVSPSIVSNSGPWMQVATGGNNASDNTLTCGLKENGNLYCWGSDNSGGIGNGSGVTADQPSPYLVGAATDLWSQVAVGKNAACAIKIDGTLWCWGSDSNSHIGGIGNQASPTAVAASSRWQRIAMNGENTCGIKVDGEAYCWGANNFGQTGIGGTATTAFGTPTLVNSPGPWLDLAVGRTNTCGIKQNGSAWCWGRGATLGKTANAFSPVLVNDPGPWTMLSVAETHICGLKNDSTAWCWGESADGKLGLGATSDIFYPTQVSGGGNWTAIKAGDTFTCGLKADNGAWCWGDDTDGQLGNGPVLTADQNVPSRVDLYPKKPAWSRNANAVSYSPPAGTSLNIGTTRSISEDGAANKGLRLNGAGRATLAQTANPSQLLIETVGNNTSAQLSLKANGALSVADNIPGLMARWKLDESTGTTAVDMISGNTGTLNNGPTWSPAGGKQAGALSFANSGAQHVRIPRTPSIEPPAVTISFWMNKTGNTGFAGLVAKNHNNNTGGGYFQTYSINMWDNTQKLAFFTNDENQGNALGLQSNTNISNNTWYFVTATYDPLAQVPQKNLYLNGSLDASVQSYNYLIYDTTSAGDLYLGMSGAPAFTGEKYFGLIDDVRIYNRALTPSEIAQLYNSYTPVNPIMREIGLDYVAGTLKFARNLSGRDQWIDTLMPDMEVDSLGNVGIGTQGQPVAKLDVNGAIKIGNVGTGCSAARAGTIDYQSGTWRYCNSSGAWTPFGTYSPPPWDTRRHGTLSACADSTTCAIRATGAANCWGDGSNGQTGDNNPSGNRLSPVLVHTDSASTGWTDWVQIAGGTLHTCGIRVNGEMWCWGENTSGELGDNTTGAQKTRPVKVHTDAAATGWTDWVATTAGTARTCGIRSNGTAWCWGNGAGGALGNFATANNARPVKVHDDASATGWTDWKSISTGVNHTCGIRANGTAWCWGSALNGRLGDSQTTTDRRRPVKVWDLTTSTGFTDWAYISAGNLNTCGIRSTGELYCWGDAATGVTGDNQTGTTRTRPVKVGTATDWATVDMGKQHACGVRENGTAWCWGIDGGGNLGDGSGNDATVPVQVKASGCGTAWTDWINVVTGDDYSCGTRSNGTIWCWGASGLLGTGATGSQSCPVMVQ